VRKQVEESGNSLHLVHILEEIIVIIAIAAFLGVLLEAGKFLRVLFIVVKDVLEVVVPALFLVYCFFIWGLLDCELFAAIKAQGIISIVWFFDLFPVFNAEHNVEEVLVAR